MPRSPAWALPADLPGFVVEPGPGPAAPPADAVRVLAGRCDARGRGADDPALWRPLDRRAVGHRAAALDVLSMAEADPDRLRGALPGWPDERRRLLWDAATLGPAAAAVADRAGGPDRCVGDLMLAEGIRPTGRQLGEGSFGSVAEAVDAGTGAPLAVKVMDSAAADDELRAHARVAWAARRLPDPPAFRRVAGVYRAFRAATTTALVMPRAEASLHDYAWDRAPLPCAERLGLLADVWLGLRALHRSGLVACDLKPGNVLVHAGGAGPPHAVVADMGLTADAGAGPGRCRGTPGWVDGGPDGGRPAGERPSTPAFDRRVFARLCAWLLADKAALGRPPLAGLGQPVPCGLATLGAATDAGASLQQGLDAGLAAAGVLPVGDLGHDLRCRATAPLRTVPAECVRDGDEARRLLAWALREELRPAEDAAPVPPGLEAAVAERERLG